MIEGSIIFWSRRDRYGLLKDKLGNEYYYDESVIVDRGLYLDNNRKKLLNEEIKIYFEKTDENHIRPYAKKVDYPESYGALKGKDLRNFAIEGIKKIREIKTNPNFRFIYDIKENFHPFTLKFEISKEECLSQLDDRESLIWRILGKRGARFGLAFEKGVFEGLLGFNRKTKRQQRIEELVKYNRYRLKETQDFLISFLKLLENESGVRLVGFYKKELASLI